METILSKDNTRIAYQRSGAGPPLVLVHGTTADHSRWAPILPALERHLTVVAMDRRGRGGSGDADVYSLQREAEDVAALVDSIGGPVNLLGHSYGATCSLEALVLTSNIHRLILYEPPPPGDKDLVPPALVAHIEALLDAGDRDGAVSLFLQEVAGLTAEQLELTRAAPSWPGRVAAAHTILRETQVEHELPPFDPAGFQGITTPVLLLLGGDSPTFFRKFTEQIHAALANSQIVVLPGQQHIAMLTAPDLFVREVLAFLTVPA